MAEINGAPVDERQITALALVNYGHFTSMRVEQQQVRGLSHHLDRLVRDCRELYDFELDGDQIRRYIKHAIANLDEPVMLRITMFDPDMELGRPDIKNEPSCLITTRAAGDLDLPPIRVESCKYNRELASAKHIGLLGPLRQRRNAQLNGFDDALFIDSDSYIAEGPTWNIGFFDGTDVIWPNADVLPGVTMRLLQQVHEQTSIAAINMRDLPRMQAAFATSAGIGVRPVVAIDDIELTETHPILDILREEYAEIPPESP